MTHPDDLNWNFWHLVPIYPYSQRRTIRTEVVESTIWTFDQVQGIFYVTVPIRMTAIKLEQGGLLIYAPVAPTRECLRLVNELVAVHGEVKYIILPTVSGLEHKVFVGPFARCFPQAQVFVAPKQWSFPLNLPLTWLGLPWRRTYTLPTNSKESPFFDEFDYSILGPLNLGLGWFGEVAFFHRRSRTLLLTDTIVSVPQEPPSIVQLDPYPLLFHARDGVTDAMEDTPANRRKGWQRTSLFALYFQPQVLQVTDLWQSIQEVNKAPDRSKKALFGWFPFKWRSDWQQSFEALRGDGRPFVAPILQQLILNRAPQETLDWSCHVATWNFQRIIPSHFDSPIVAGPWLFRQAFGFLEQQPAIANATLPEADFALLKQLDSGFTKVGIVPPAKAKV